MEENNVRFVPVTTQEQIEKTSALAKEIWQDCYAHLLKPEQINYMVNNMQSVPAITRQLEEENFSYYLIYAGEEEAGYIGIQVKDDKLMLSKLYLLAQYRGQGVGQKAMAFVEHVGRERQCDGIWLTVNRNNQRAISIYRKTGYEITREEVTDIGSGFVMDDFIFEKPL